MERIEIARQKRRGQLRARVHARRVCDEAAPVGRVDRRGRAQPALLATDSPAVVDGSDDIGVFTARPKVRGEPRSPATLRRSREAILKGIRSAVTTVWRRPRQPQAHRPYGTAIALSVSTDDPARFLADKMQPLLTSLVPPPSRRGRLPRVLENRRQLVLEWGSWTRNPAGTFWVRRDLADCSPIRQSGPPGTQAAAALSGGVTFPVRHRSVCRPSA